MKETRNSRDMGSLEIESSEETYVRISKPFKTASGDMIKVVLTDGGNAIIKSTTKSDLGSVMVINISGDVIAKGFFEGLWDLGKEILGKVLDVVIDGGGGGGGGGGGNCTSGSSGNVTIVVNGNQNAPINVNTNICP